MVVGFTDGSAPSLAGLRSSAVVPSAATATVAIRVKVMVILFPVDVVTDTFIKPHGRLLASVGRAVVLCGTSSIG